MVSFTLLRIWHYLSLVVAVASLLVLMQYYCRSFFSRSKGDSTDESG